MTTVRTSVLQNPQQPTGKKNKAKERVSPPPMSHLEVEFATMDAQAMTQQAKRFWQGSLSLNRNEIDQMVREAHELFKNEGLKGTGVRTSLGAGMAELIDLHDLLKRSQVILGGETPVTQQNLQVLSRMDRQLKIFLARSQAMTANPSIAQALRSLQQTVRAVDLVQISLDGGIEAVLGTYAETTQQAQYLEALINHPGFMKAIQKERVFSKQLESLYRILRREQSPDLTREEKAWRSAMALRWQDRAFARNLEENGIGSLTQSKVDAACERVRQAKPESSEWVERARTYLSQYLEQPKVNRLNCV